MNTNRRKMIESIAEQGKADLDHLMLLDAILEHAPVLISAKDLEGNIIFANQKFSELDGPEPEAMVEKNVFDLFPYEIAKQLWDNDLKAQQSDKPILAEESVLHKDGTTHTYHTTKFKLFGKTGGVVGTCAISVNISERKKLEFDAYHDYLTGLYNQRYFEENLIQDIKEAGHRNKHFTFALIDLDGFKEVNDVLGHKQGDQVLIAVATALVRVFKSSLDKCMRLGGDEFGVTFFSESELIATQRLKVLHREINNALEHALFDSDVACTNSIGVKTIKPNEEFNYSQLFTQVDRVLYRAKHAGKNTIYFL